MKQPVLNYQIDGNNRGGTLHATLLANKLEARTGEVALVLNDIEPGRSAQLARQLARQGIEARPHVRSALANPDADIHCLSVDDPTPVLPILDGPVRTPLLEIGQLLAPSADSGSVLGIGVALDGTDESGRRDALHLFARLSALVPERRSSRVMSAPIRHSVQMRPVRHYLHDYLTDKSMQFMKGNATASEFRVFDGLARGNYLAVITEAGRNTKRRDLKSAALHDVVPSTFNGRFAVIYYDRAEAWIYVVLGMREARRPHLATAIEVPSPVPTPPVLPALTGRSPRAAQAPTSWLRALITD